MEERRESRIPKFGIPKPLAEKNTVAPAGDRKRKATGLETVPEQKRVAGASRPARSAPVPAEPAPTASTAAAPSFQSEGHNRIGPAPGEETFEDIHDKTGATVIDILNKKLQFKKGTKPDKKVEDMVPMIKELRAVGWHLHAGKERADMDAQQWKSHSDMVEASLAAQKQLLTEEQTKFNDALKLAQDGLDMAMTQNQKLSKDLDEAEVAINGKIEELATLRKKLEETQSDLDKANKAVEEKDAKIQEMHELVRQGQGYSATLQSYNTSLQADIKEEKLRREEVGRERDSLQSKAAELGGMVKSLEQLLQFEREQVQKLRDERESGAKDLAVLRADLDSTRQDRDRLLADNNRMKDETDKIRKAGGKSLETLEMLNNDKATMETQLATQTRMMNGMREELAMSKEQRALAQALADSRGSQIGELKGQIQQLQESLADAEKRVYEGELIRRKLHNTIQELKGNIRVFCRVRPVSAAEQASADHDSTMAVDYPSTGDLLGCGIALQAPQRGETSVAAKHSFSFDKVFSPTATQEQVFEEISELVQSALDGHKVCIFAYGQTGSGKTFTMLGNPEHQGMIPRAMRQVFECSRKLASQGWSFTMQAAMLEIYNEEYKDLLCKKKAQEGKKHQVIHNADGSTTVSDLTYVDVSTAERVESLLVDAMEKRTVGCTALNEQSSRSHMVFNLKIDGQNSTTGVSIAGVLNLIDLAGSERVKESGATGVRLKEAQNINKSLSALGDVIMAIANKESHVPFRNSKLTYLLQPCLGGDAKTLMFVNIAPSREFAGESLCSLRFAAKVNACEINPRRNVKV